MSTSVLASRTVLKLLSVFLWGGSKPSFSCFNGFLDQDGHFLNKVMELPASPTIVRHCFSTAYAPWSNVTVESVLEERLQVLHALFTELMIPETEWVKPDPVIQYTINYSPSNRLEDRASSTVHMGIQSKNPLSISLSTTGEKQLTIDNQKEIRLLQKLNIEKLLQTFYKMYKVFGSHFAK